MKKVSTNVFRENLADYLDEVAENKTSIVVSKYDKPLVKVVPYDEENDDVENFFGFLPDDGEDGVEFEDRIRRTKKEKKYVEDLREGKK